MTPDHTLRLGGLLVLVCMSAGHSLARQQVHAERVHVRFLATSTLIRGTWSQNEDTYLAELLFIKKNEAVLVRLIDAYPNEWPPIPLSVLGSQASTVLRVTRDSKCDFPFSRMLLRTAPGDPMAILHERMTYQPKLENRPRSNELLPCYRTVRK